MSRCISFINRPVRSQRVNLKYNFKILQRVLFRYENLWVKKIVCNFATAYGFSLRPRSGRVKRRKSRVSGDKEGIRWKS